MTDKRAGVALTATIRKSFPRADPVGGAILAASHSTGVPVSYLCALIEKESGFRNVFGHDPVANPVKGGPVTRGRYAQYKFWRKRGKGMQGVGYTQLTWFSFQDEADKLGGCWRAYPNIAVGARLLGSLTHSLGEEKGAARFNGTGPAATAYGKDFVARQKTWHGRLT